MTSTPFSGHSTRSFSAIPFRNHGQYFDRRNLPFQPTFAVLRSFVATSDHISLLLKEQQNIAKVLTDYSQQISLVSFGSLFEFSVQPSGVVLGGEVVSC